MSRKNKAEAEDIVIKANDPPNLLTAAIRPAGIIGEGDVMALYHMINLFRDGRHRVQVGDNNNLFDFTYVENVAHAHLLAAQALLVTRDATTAPLDHERVDGEVFFVTNGEPVYFWDFCRTVWRHAGADDGNDSIWILPRGLGMVLASLSEAACALVRRSPTLTRQRIVYSCMTRYYDISKARRRLGYKPLVELEEGIKRGVQWSFAQEKAGLLKRG